MLTPLDIQNKTFGKSVRGYNVEEVEEYMALIVRSMEELIHVNIDTTTQNKEMEKQLAQYRLMEKTISDAMVLAQQTSEEMIKNAHDKASYIIERADDQAKKLISDANAEVLNVIKRQEEAKHALETFKMKFKLMVESQMRLYEEQDLK